MFLEWVHYTSNLNANNLVQVSVNRARPINGGDFITESKRFPYNVSTEPEAQTAKRYVRNGCPEHPNKPHKSPLRLVAFQIM